MDYNIGYPIDESKDNVKESVEKLIKEVGKIYADLEETISQVNTLLANGDVDKVDGKHCDNTANNAPYLNASGHLTVDTEGTAWNIPTSDVGGNLWIA